MNKQYYKENLPMYVNGNLTAEESDGFERELAEDDALKKEAEFLSAIRHHVKNEQVKTPGEMGLYKLKRQINKEAENTLSNKRTSKRWRTFAIAASLTLIIQAGFMVTMTQENDLYKPLSGSDFAENVIQVQFVSDAKESDIREMLLDFNGSIIEGPSKNGIYRIYIKNLDDKVINQLQQRTHVINFVTEE